MISEPITVSEATITEVWRTAVNLLLDNGARTGLVAHIREPDMPNPGDLAEFDPTRIDRDAMSIADVANTIFPKNSAKWQFDVEEFAEHYFAAYRRMHRSRPQSWGYYFQRLVKFGDDEVNQLCRLVTRLNGWGRNNHAALVVHLSSAETDRPRPLGGPCLQYFQVGKVNGSRIGLTAVYRSHDFFYKALGNYIGLSRVLHYLCTKTQLDVGPITCLSSYAFLGSSKRNSRRLLDVR